jgi:hypothetical protein
MADHYLRASFTIPVTSEEAELMREIRSTYLDGLDTAELVDLYNGRSEAFRRAFPGTAEDPFAGYRSLFTDPDEARPSFSMTETAACDAGTQLAIFGDNVDVESLAQIIHAVCKTAQPCGFAYAYGCTKLRENEFGGGYVVIGPDGPEFHDTDSDLRRALSELQSEDARPLVITARSRDHGLDFWNNETGFGRLADATVFTPAEAANYDLPIADDEPEWLTLPRGGS